jgi:hypothetical protein
MIALFKTNIEQCLYRLNKFFVLSEGRKLWMVFHFEESTLQRQSYEVRGYLQVACFWPYHHMRIRIYYQFKLEYEEEGNINFFGNSIINGTG